MEWHTAALPQQVVPSPFVHVLIVRLRDSIADVVQMQVASRV
jgi:hypothetical protein